MNQRHFTAPARLLFAFISCCTFCFWPTACTSRHVAGFRPAASSSADGKPSLAPAGSRFQTQLGAIIRGPTDRRRIALVFTGHEYAEGAGTILDALKVQGGRASFFLTGVFLSNTNHSRVVSRLIREGHYLGPHSDQHLLYCAWEPARTTLITQNEFTADLQANLQKIRRLHPRPPAVRFFLPPYEHYNPEIATWTASAGLTLINYTPGTRSNADYTGEADRNFVDSKTIFESILRQEREDPHGLNGFILLLHVGAGPGRTDKFQARFPELLRELKDRGYEFVRVDELLSGAP